MRPRTRMCSRCVRVRTPARCPVAHVRSPSPPLVGDGDMCSDRALVLPGDAVAPGDAIVYHASGGWRRLPVMDAAQLLHTRGHQTTTAATWAAWAAGAVLQTQCVQARPLAPVGVMQR